MNLFFHEISAPSQGASPSSASRPFGRLSLKRLSEGGILGGLLVAAIGQLKLDVEIAPAHLIGGAVMGALLATTRARAVLWLMGGMVLASALVVGLTPLVPLLVQDNDQTDGAASADAVVVLGCGMQSDGLPSTCAQDRLIQAAAAARAGRAGTIVLCGVLWTPPVRQLLRDWGADVSILWSGPVFNTHDEALAVARLANARKWKSVIVVTQAWHMPRASAVFKATGLTVLRLPCPESRYDRKDPRSMDDRLQALRDWLHEAVGMRLYRWRGWVA